MQKQFQAYLCNDDTTIAQHVVDPTGLNVYQKAYQIRMVRALANNYPMLKRYLGATTFTELAVAYLHAFPSTTRSIRWFGAQLPEFLNDTFLRELALIEWTMTLVYDAADAPIATVDTITAMSPESWAEMHCIPHPATHLLTLTSNAMSIWQSLMAHQLPPDPCQEPVAHWIFWRNNFVTQYAALATKEAWAVQAMFASATFAEICTGLCQWLDPNTATLEAASLLKSWILGHLISTITPDNNQKVSS